MTPKFSAYPFSRLPRRTRREAELDSTIARWLAARGRGDRLARLAGGPVRAAVGSGQALDPFAARCTVRVPGASVEVHGSSMAVRRIAQRVLGGPDELRAPRPLGVVERSLFALVVATALEDLGVPGEVWPLLGDAGEPAPDADLVALDVTLADILLAVQLRAPAELFARVPPAREVPAWLSTTRLELPIVLGRCALDRPQLAKLAPRSVITLERPAAGAELAVLGGSVGLAAAAGAVVATVATGYVPRDMSLPDDARVELTVELGTTQLSLRQVTELAVGQIVQLGRPLAGPFELRAAGRVLGRGELVDVDGELAVRIVSLGD